MLSNTTGDSEAIKTLKQFMCVRVHCPKRFMPVWATITYAPAGPKGCAVGFPPVPVVVPATVHPMHTCQLNLNLVLLSRAACHRRSFSTCNSCTIPCMHCAVPARYHMAVGHDIKTLKLTHPVQVIACKLLVFLAAHHVYALRMSAWLFSG